ncbi:MAG TPA: cytochrome b/b6 domain-containing protein [Thermodesulfovibrionales bacterium]|nr:cytochrome b/b6 domain-containing protein [Thermodesulfovibrionales bacterium]
MKKIYLHPLPIRIWHWVNAGGFIFLILTGAQIRGIIKLFSSVETAVEIHSWLGFILLANYCIWLFYYFLTVKIKIYIPPLHHPVEFAKKALRQAKFYGFGIMVGDQNPHHSTPDNKFNPMQQVSYLMIMALLIPVQIITGLFLWDPKLFSPIVTPVGIQIVSAVHVFLWIFFSAFIIVHFYLATLGHTTWAHIIAMFTGYEEEHEEGHGHGEEHGHSH